jgi:hypothetical protein
MDTVSNTTPLEHLKQQFEQMIDGIALGDLQKRFLRDRWLEQLLWFESKATANQRRYYVFRLVTIVGGVIVPALVSLNVRQNNVADTLAWITFSVSLVVAIAAAMDGFFGFGERWRSFRRTAELMKADGWQYFELSGPYAAPDHAAAFARFTAHTETLIQQDLKAFIAQAAQAHAAQPHAAQAQLERAQPEQASSEPGATPGEPPGTASSAAGS